MIKDILTVMWMERKGLFRHQGSVRTVVLNLVVFVGMFGIFFPLQEGPGYVSSFFPVIGGVLIPALLVGMKIPDSFAGEKERHTLATLLASRLPDEAILFGKVVTAVAYGWGMGLVVLLVGLVTVNVVHWDGRLLLYSPRIAVVAVGLSLLVAVFVAGVGIFISLRAATVQEATQTLMFAVLVLPMVLQMVLFVALRSGPGGKERIREVLGSLGSTEFILAVMAVLLIIDVGLLMAAMARFQRARLYLD